MELLKSFRSARQVAVPIVGIATYDQADVIKKLRASVEDGAKTPIPLFSWDIMDGLKGLNKSAVSALEKVIGGEVKDWPKKTSNPAAALGYMSDLPGEKREGDVPTGAIQSRGSIVFMLNSQRFLEDRGQSNANAGVLQGIWNLRDRFKANRRTLVLLGPSFQFPPEISNDVITLDVPVPTEEELQSIVKRQVAECGLSELSDSTLAQAVDAIRGLPSSFTAEQITAMSMTKDGLEVDTLWDRKITEFEKTQGLSIDRGTQTFDDIGGLDAFKAFAMRLIKGKECPLIFVRLDEIEKMLGGAGGNGAPADNTGVSQDALGVLLRYMEDEDWIGILTPGVPGTGKSLITKALANTATRETGKKALSVALDLGAARGSLVGESERKIRDIMKRLKGLGGKRVCILATCNRLDVLPPELLSRFRLGRWYFDLPTTVEKKAIWKINLAKFDVQGPLPNDENWTGREIRNACDIASRLGCSVKEAAEYVVPVATSDPETIDRLRSQANGKFLSASYPGPFKVERYLSDKYASVSTDAPTAGRAVAARDEEV